MYSNGTHGIEYSLEVLILIATISSILSVPNQVDSILKKICIFVKYSQISAEEVLQD
jgi:hypothetical protein